MRKRIATFAIAVSATLGLAAGASALSPPVLTSPPDGGTITGWRNITFTWDLASGLPKYGIQIQALDSSNNWVDVKVFHGIDSSISRYTFANFTTSDYGRWRARSEGSSSNSAWSGWRLFYIGPGISTVPQKPKVYEYNKAITVGGGATADGTVLCPTGTIVVGGGWSSGSATSVYTQSSTWGNEYWQASFVNLTGSSRTVTVYAECLANASGYSYAVMKSVYTPPGGVAVTQSTCGKGVLTGGGFLAESQSLPAYSMIPYSATGWGVYGYNTGSSNETLFGEAVCLAGSGAKTNLAIGSMHSLAGFGSGSAGVNCVSSKVALGGGVNVTHDGTVMTAFRRSSGNGWHAGVQELDSSSNGYKIFTICAKWP